jgi:hypothetical protein
MTSGAVFADAGKCSEGQLLLACPGQGDVSDLDGDMLGARHVLSSLGSWTAVLSQSTLAENLGRGVPPIGQSKHVFLSDG